MPREVSLPPPFAWLAGQVHYVQQHSATEWSASCPECGGDVHPDGEWPDRLRIFVDEHPRVWCRHCSYMRWADQGGQPPDAATVERWRAEQIRREEERKRSAERALAHLRSGRIWEQYHDQLDAWARDHWRRRGLADCWQDYWQLGYSPEERFGYQGQTWTTPTVTIPLFGQDWEALNVKHRLLNVPPDGGKYRYALAGVGQPMFRCNPERALEGDVVAVEGEIKAAVVFATLDSAQANVVGLPGTSPGPDIITQLGQAERVTLVMDPGARAQAWRLAQKLGVKRTRVLICPCKPDDAIVSQRMSAAEVRSALRHALPAG